MSATEKENLLRDEYLFLQETYEDFDQRALLIKGWSVTVSLGGLVVGLQYGKPYIWAIAALAGVLFWTIEAMWKGFQYCFSPRIQEIEAHFRGEAKYSEIKPLQIYSSWFEAYQEQSGGVARDLIQSAFLPLVFLPHVVSVFAALALLTLHYVFGVRLV